MATNDAASLTQLCATLCQEFRDSSFDFSEGWEIKCFAQQRDYGCRVVIALYLDNDMRSQNVVRLLHASDLTYLHETLNTFKALFLRYAAVTRIGKKPPTNSSTSTSISSAVSPPSPDTVQQTISDEITGTVDIHNATNTSNFLQGPTVNAWSYDSE